MEAAAVTNENIHYELQSKINQLEQSLSLTRESNKEQAAQILSLGAQLTEAQATAEGVSISLVDSQGQIQTLLVDKEREHSMLLDASSNVSLLQNEIQNLSARLQEKEISDSAHLTTISYLKEQLSLRSVDEANHVVERENWKVKLSEAHADNNQLSYQVERLTAELQHANTSNSQEQVGSQELRARLNETQVQLQEAIRHKALLDEEKHAILVDLDHLRIQVAELNRVVKDYKSQSNVEGRGNSQTTSAEMTLKLNYICERIVMVCSEFCGSSGTASAVAESTSQQGAASYEEAVNCLELLQSSAAEKSIAGRKREMEWFALSRDFQDNIESLRTLNAEYENKLAGLTLDNSNMQLRMEELHMQGRELRREVDIKVGTLTKWSRVFNAVYSAGK
jgi:chromosome segregation ATPase